MNLTRRISAIFMLLVAIPLAQAQSVAGNGAPNFSSFSGGPDVINNSNLNIHYTVPVFSRAGVGLPFSYSMSVDNGVWYKYKDIYLNAHWGYDSSTAQPVGVMAIGAVFISYGQTTCHDSQGPYTDYYEDITSFTGPDNTSHGSFGVRVYSDVCPNRPNWSTGPVTGIASDGSGISVTLSAYQGSVSVTLANGTVIKPPHMQSGSNPPSGTYTIQDTNNNTITVSAGSNGQINYIYDTLGTQPITSSGGPPPASIAYAYPAPSGAQANVAVSYKTVTVQSAWGCSAVAEYPATSKSLIDKITLADGTYYQFFYEPTSSGSGNTTGRISQVHLPTGGTISYNYTGGDTGKGIFCADGSTAGLNRVSSQSGTVQYTRTVSTDSYGDILSGTTQIADNSGNTTVASFQMPSMAVTSSSGALVETRHSVYQGAASGTPLEDVITCYNFVNPINPSTCLTSTPSGPPFTRVTTFRSLNGGPQAEVDTYRNSYGLVTKRDVYDWGATAYTQETQTTYDSTLGAGIVDHPSTVKLFDGAGNLKSETDYSYDDFTIPGDTKTCSPATKCRGNLTKLTKYASSTNKFTTQMTYNLNGTVATGLDPNGTTTTTFTYSAGGCNAFPTQTKVTAGSITLTSSVIYNCSGAVATSTTDANNKTTSTNYTDPYFWRPVSTADQLNNTTTFAYTGQTTVESVMTFNASRSTIDTLSTRDAFGRPEYTQKRQGVGSGFFDSVQQVYDSSGRPYKSSMPYQGAAGSPPSSGIYTQTTFDAMMRATQVQDAGGGILNTNYNENDVYQEAAPAPTSENTKRKQLEYDGLGRLTSVCEITNDTKYGGACGQATGGYSGYLTKYIYDNAPNVNSLTVNQNVQPNGGTSQQRTYIYDMLGRLTYESNPETQVKYYYYDSLTADTNCGTISSPGDLVKTVDNKGIVTCLTYDGLHRVTSISYPNSSPATATKVFVYESATVNGTTMGLTAGRLAEAYTCTTCTPTPTKLTDIGFTYSARGEITDTYESTPHSGTYYHVSAGYWPHGLLSSLGTPGLTLPTIYYGGSSGSGLDGEGRVTQVTAGTSANLASSVIYTTSGTTQPIGSLTAVTYGSGDSDSFGYDTSTGRLTSYMFNVNGSVASSGGLTWNANGTLGTLFQVRYLMNKETCGYSHDDLARITSVTCNVPAGGGTTWQQNFTYDPFGNVTKTANPGITFQPSYNPATNQYSALPGCTPSYDLDGNLTSDCTNTFSWLGDGSVGAVNSVSLTYDALGRAVEQTQASGYTQIMYTPGGSKLALMSGSTVQKAFIPLPGGGTAVYTSNGLTYYRHSDWLGSSRLGSAPTAPTSVYAAVEYAPFGEPYSVYGNLDLDFTGQNQDTISGTAANPDSGLYDFLFREYNPQHGRWISPDPAGMGAVSMGSPQTWNRYAYVGNSPLISVDALGLSNWDAWSCWPECGYDGFGNPNSTTYYVDGMQVSAMTAQYLQSMGAAINCGNQCNQLLSGQGVVGGDNQIYRWTPGKQPTDCYAGDGGTGNGAQYSCPGGPWSLKPTGEYAANNGNFSWWGAFASNLFSWKNFTNEFKHGGCVNVAVNATASALNPFSPSLSSAGEGTAAVLAASKYNAAVQYAASAPNYLGGTGLIYPMKSSVVRGMIADANATAASGGLMSLDLALAQGFGTEMHSMATGGCH